MGSGNSEGGTGNSSSNTNGAVSSITFSDCSIELNAKDDKGNDRMAYHFTAELSGMEEHGIQMILSVESPEGTPHTYIDEEGDEIIVNAKKDFKNKYKTDSFSLRNKIVGIQNSKLHLKDGENTYYLRLTAYDENSHAEIGSSPCLSVTLTGNSSPDSNQTGSGSNNSGTGSGSKKWAKIEYSPCEIAEVEDVCHWIIPTDGIIANGSIIKMDDNISGFSIGQENYPKWDYVPAGDGSYYVCWAKNHNYVLEVQNGSAVDGAHLQLYQRNDSKGQRWFFEACHSHPEDRKRDHDAFIIHSALNIDYVIEMSGRTVVLKPYTGSITQMWYIR